MKTAGRFRSLATAPWRAWLALCFVGGLLLGPAQAAQHAWAMALGSDICSAADEPAAGAATAAHPCCDAGLSALPPPAVPAAPRGLPSALPQPAARPGHVPCAGCALPPSRGPPVGASLPLPH